MADEGELQVYNPADCEEPDFVPRKILVYLAGPITGATKQQEAANVDNALHVWALLAQAGFPVYCPHASWIADNTLSRPLKHIWVDLDLVWLGRCDVLIVMPGSGSSLGAQREVRFAEKRGITVVYMKVGDFDCAQLIAKLSDIEHGTLDKQNTTTHSTGARESKLNVRYDLIPPLGLEAVARVSMQGAEKYGERNWQKGIPHSSMINHAITHLYRYLQGGTSEDHLGHAAWRCLAAIDARDLWPDLNT